MQRLTLAKLNYHFSHTGSQLKIPCELYGQCTVQHLVQTESNIVAVGIIHLLMFSNDGDSWGAVDATVLTSDSLTNGCQVPVYRGVELMEG